MTNRLNMKKVCSLLLTVLMLLSITLVGCSSESASRKKAAKEETTILGTWVGEMDYSEQLREAELAEELQGYLDPDKMKITVIMEFDEDECTLSIDEDSLDELIDYCISVCCNRERDRIIEKAEKNHMSVDAYIKESYPAYNSLDDVIEDYAELYEILFHQNDEYFVQSFTYDYQLDGKKLYGIIDGLENDLEFDNYIEIKLTSKKLQFLEIHADDDVMDQEAQLMLAGTVFKRK